MGASVGVDVGGTFTDLVAVVDGELVTAKVPSVRGSEARGIAAALRASGVGEVDVLAHGTTVATNALLERRGARTALVTTEGFRDVIEIGRQARASLYDLAAHHPAPLVPRELRFTVRERMGPEGVLVPLDEGSLSAAVEAVRAAGVEAVAVCLLFSFLHPEHERRVGEALRAGAARHARLPLGRAAARVPRVRALLDDRRERLPRAGAIGLSRRDRAAAARDAVVRRRRRRGHRGGAPSSVRPLRPGGRRRRRGVRRGSRRGARRAHVRHGRHEHRRRRRSRRQRAGDGGVGRRRRPDPVPDGRHPHDRGGRRLDRLVGRRRRASRRAALRGRRPGAGVLRARRRGADGDRCEPGSRPPPGRCRPRRGDPARPVARRARTGAARDGRARGRRRRDPSRRREHGPGAARRLGGARHRPARPRSRRLRRRGAAARVLARRGARDRASARPARLGRPQRARPCSRRPAPRLRRLGRPGRPARRDA